MKFQYRARTKDGLIQFGVIDTSNRQRAASLLQEQGFYITFLEPEERTPFYARELNIFDRIGKKEIMNFSRQLSLMIKSGIGLVDALRTIALQSEKQKVRKIILKVADDVEGGIYFSDALARFPKIFSPFFINMIKSGEASGRLSNTLKYLSENLEREYNLYLKIKMGMMYPAFVLVVFALVGILMLFFVFPSFTETIASLEVQLPKITIFVIAFGSFLQRFWWMIAIFLTFIVSALVFYVKTPEGKKYWNKIVLNFPIIGGIMRKIYIIRIAENISTLIFAGLHIAQSLDVVSGIISNQTYQNIVIDARDSVRKGDSLSSVLVKYPKSITPTVVQMVKVGERTGRLDEALIKIADFYRVEVYSSIDGLISIIEPIMIIIVGGLIAGLVLSIFLPLYKNLSTIGF